MEAPRDDMREIELANELKVLVLEDFVRLAKDNKLSPTDRRTIVSMLQQNGWTLDPNRLPQDLRDKLKKDLPDAADGLAEEYDI